MKTHVVTTLYRRPLTGKVVAHAYGPYTETEAKRERRRMMAEWADEVNSGALHIAACKVLDIDAMNAKIKEDES